MAGILNWASILDDNTRKQAEVISRAPGVAGHVALMPDAHLGIGATVGSVIPTYTDTIIPAAVGVDIGCFRGDTRVPLLDGKQQTMRDLAEDGGYFWVYSIDQATQEIAPGKARAVLTRTDAPLVRVVISGGEAVICTPDHQFMLSDGTWRRADALQFNDSLMPLYRTWEMRDGYEHANNGKGKNRPTHTRVYEYIYGPLPQGQVIHHINHNHFDNRPENLFAMEPAEHSRHHRHTRPVFDNASPEFQAVRLAGIAKANKRPERQAQMAEIGARNITTYMRKRPERFQDAVTGNGRRGAKYLRKFNTSPRACQDCAHIASNPAALYWHRDKEHSSNHKVISVDHLEGQEDVFCLQVEEHHNFALAAGVFVHNCGMMACRTDIDALPQDLSPLVGSFGRSIPAGVGRDHPNPTEAALEWLEQDPIPDPSIFEATRIGVAGALNRAARQLGTLGSGNHFVEVCLDTEDAVWLLLHTGSRGVGNMIAQVFIDIAKFENTDDLEDPNTARLVGESFGRYIEMMQWAQRYAFANRELMMLAMIADVEEYMGTFKVLDTINCHHNFAALEEHFGQTLWITRKGAIRARKGDMGIIPGSMGAATYIVEGLGNPDSYCSSAHGAGRMYSRGHAKRTFDVESLQKYMQGKVWNSNNAKRLLDEHPLAYKPIAQVMADQEDLVRPVTVLRQIVNFKGS